MSIEIKENKLSIKNRYRPEIDGLRAFAVSAVIINHFNKEILPNGYLGVDIFFVISGFVITSSLYERQSKNFKDFIIGFYERRIKRLVPALSVFVLITSIAICLFQENPYLSLWTGLTSLFGLSNIYLWEKATDYFAQSTELNVFTHTWSLGVEEQFYMIFPFLIWFSGFGRQTKNGTRNLFVMVGVLTIASLIGFFYLYPIDQPAAYFLLPTRFWEMATGCLIFIGFQKRKSIKKLVEQVPPLLVLVLIIGVMYLPMWMAPLSTIAVVTLSSILIACLKKQTAAYKFFTSPIVVYVGLISYSLYLWHWGVLSISRWTIGIHWWSVPFQVTLMLGLAICSYRYIETPLRNENWFRKRWNIILVGGSVIVTLSSVLVALIEPLKGKLYSGKPIKDFSILIDKPIEFKGDITGRIAKSCHSSDNKKNDALKGSNKITSQFMKNCLSAKSQKPLVAFVGDSHSLSIFPTSEVIASTSKFDVFSHSRGGCAFPAQGKTYRKDCYEVQQSVAKEILEEISKRNKGSVVVVGSYLNSHFGYDGVHRFQFKKYSNGSKSSVDKNLSEYINSLKIFASNLKTADASLIVVAPLPQHPSFIPELCSPQWFISKKSINKNCYKTKKNFLQKQRKHIVKAINSLAMEVKNIYIFDPFNKFCDEKYCYVKKDKSYLFSDNNHLSKEGAIMISNDLRTLINFSNSPEQNSN